MAANRPMHMCALEFMRLPEKTINIRLLMNILLSLLLFAAIIPPALSSVMYFLGNQ